MNIKINTHGQSKQSSLCALMVVYLVLVLFMPLAPVRGADDAEIVKYIKILKQDNDSTSYDALRHLRSIGEPAIPNLIAALKDRKEITRLRIVRLFSGYYSFSHNPPEWWTWWTTSEKAPAVVDALIESLNDQSHDVRLAAVEALGFSGNAKGVPLLIQTLKSDLDEHMQVAVSKALVKIGAPATPTLVELLTSNHEVDQKLIIPILAEFDPAALGVKTEAIVESLLHILISTNSETRLDVLKALKNIIPKSQFAVDALISLVKKDNNLDVRLEAMFVLGAIGQPATNAVPALIEALNDELPRMQWAAATALGNIGPDAKAAVPALIKHVERLDVGNEDELKALGKIGFAARTAIPAIIAHMRNLADTDVTKDADTGQARHLYVHAASLIRIAEGIRENVDTQSIPALESMVLVLNDFNFPPKVVRRVQEPLDFLKAEVAAGRGPPPTMEEITQCWNLIVQIEGNDPDGKPVLGSGIIFGCKEDTLYIATAKHVVRRGLSPLADIKVKAKSLLPGEALTATLTSDSTSSLDLAVLVVRDIQKYKIPLEKIPFDRVGKPQSLGANDKVYALGLPITQAGEPLPADDFMEAAVFKLIFRSTKTVREGYSGGALFNANWQLVGMIRADDPPFANAIAIDQILAQLKEWGYPVNLTTHTP